MCETPLKEHLELYHEIRKSENARYVQKNISQMAADILISASWFHNSDSHKTQMCFTLPSYPERVVTFPVSIFLSVFLSLEKLYVIKKKKRESNDIRQ